MPKFTYTPRRLRCNITLEHPYTPPDISAVDIMLASMYGDIYDCISQFDKIKDMLRYVEFNILKPEPVLPDDHNIFVDFIHALKDFLHEMYILFGVKKSLDLPVRVSYVKSYDAILSDHHNSVVIALKFLSKRLDDLL
ncbi:MAG: hypothetical protein DRP74_08585 [Candidatus Omnitrophota bacterium]|nr:MAG: hypothetical protein DRP74_08585 [Candidatus Omnitrophota bacterium]